MINTKIRYKSYEIEADDEFGFIVMRGVVAVSEFGTMKEAKEFIDALEADVHEARRLGY